MSETSAHKQVLAGPWRTPLLMLPRFARVALPVALLCLLVVPGAYAGADPVSDRVGGAQRVAEQGTAAAAAACRRSTPASDEQCAAVPSTPSVSEAALLAYEKGAVHRALAFQQALGDDLPLRFAPWIGTHNSFNSSAQDPTLSQLDANQQLSMADQLRLDVRSLELDAHWFPSAAAAGSNAAVLCHAQERRAEARRVHHRAAAGGRPPRDRHVASRRTRRRSCWCTWRTTFEVDAGYAAAAAGPDQPRSGQQHLRRRRDWLPGPAARPEPGRRARCGQAGPGHEQLPRRCRLERPGVRRRRAGAQRGRPERVRRQGGVRPARAPAPWTRGSRSTAPWCACSRTAPP